jgi:hypothetical protein
MCISRLADDRFAYQATTEVGWDDWRKDIVYHATTPIEQRVAEGRAVIWSEGELGSFTSEGRVGGTYYAQEPKIADGPAAEAPDSG